VFPDGSKQYYSMAPAGTSYLAPDPYWANTVLYAKLATDITDVRGTALTVRGAVVNSSTIKKYLSGSASLPALTSISWPTSSNFAFTGDFTIEFWMYQTGNGTTDIFIWNCAYPAVVWANTIYCFQDSAGTVRFYYQGNSTGTA